MRATLAPGLVVCVALVVSCSLERAPLSPSSSLDAARLDGGGTSLDAPIDIDTGIVTDEDAGPVGVDAGPVEIDGGPTGCAPACTAGTVCSGVTCVCPAGACCPGCGAAQTCTGGTCTACGAPSQPCCGATCNAGAECAAGTCAACGADGRACCGGSACIAPATCMTGRCVTPPPPCGAASQACCPGSMCATANLICDTPPFFPARCVSCGGTDQPCCAGNVCSVATDNCAAGTCRRCGSPYTRCCIDGSCLFGSRCAGGTCIY